jgi:DNA-binding IclR family transcriptional regulator
MYRDTSRAAWTSKQPTLGEQEALVLDAIRKAGPRGVTIYDLSQLLGMIYGTASARVRGLYLKSLIRDTGEFGLTNTGRRAMRWAVVPPRPVQLALFHEARP